MIIYDTTLGITYYEIPDNQDMDVFIFNKPISFKNRVSSFIGDYPVNWYDYRIVDGELILLTNQEQIEIRTYGKILTDYERDNIPPPPIPLPTETDILKEQVKELQSVIDILLEG